MISALDLASASNTLYFFRSKGSEEGAGTVNTATSLGATPAYAAAACGHAAILKMLHGEGADLAAADKHGVTPLHAAVYHRHVEVLDYLLQVVPSPFSSLPVAVPGL